MPGPRLAATPEVLGKLLADARKGSNLTQMALADRMGMRQATVSRLETHTRDSHVDTLYRALSALGLELRVQPIPSESDSDW